MSALDPPAAILSVIPFIGPLPAAQQYRPPPERVLGGDPVQRAYNLFSSQDGRFHSGIWECAIGCWRVAFTESEFCHLLSGVIAVTAADGTQRIFRAGDAFVSPAGFTGIWDVREPARKYYAIYE
jgi:uncharacterized cupin superfamily protein